jgi:hypothetical protein
VYKGSITSSVSLRPFLNAKTVEVNFGTNAFAYTLPDGYRPFDAQ